MLLEELKHKALSLPLLPGVYIMKDKTGAVIYVGKAKKLKNRVSQYFQDTASHSTKTRHMVSNIDQFDVIVAESEFEALVLECSLIKQYQPKYNILLKDDKGYPYLRLNMKDAYPTITMVSKVLNDGAQYFGPFGSRGVTGSVLESVRLALKLPNCSKQFPRDIGKSRPCLHYHMKQCAGWCQPGLTQADYTRVINQAKQLLQGRYKAVADNIRTQMLSAADSLNFELAASLRDRLHAVESLGKKQLVTAGATADTDVIGYAQTDIKACFTVLHFSNGTLVDKEFEIFSVPDSPEAAISALMKQFYLSRGFAPRFILLPFELEDRLLFEQLLEREYGKKTAIRVPQRGDKRKLVAMAVKNAQEEADRVTDKEDKLRFTLTTLGKMLGISGLDRIESYDISNLSNTDIVSSMVVFRNGRPDKQAYKRFRIQDMHNQDDYASMAQTVRRRFLHYKDGDPGFDILPDLILIDGGITHAKTAQAVLDELGIHVPVFGMVKDNRHRTRALVSTNAQEIRIDMQQSVFSLIGNIQEETHRFAISYHRKLRSKRLRYSELDSIPGIGPKRKADLLKTYKSLTEIRAASISELERFLPKNVANAVYDHFNNKKEG